MNDLMPIQSSTTDFANNLQFGDFLPNNNWYYPQPTYIFPTITPTPITYSYQTTYVTPRCAWCMGTHIGKCERLPKSIEFRPDGTVAKIEFFEEGNDK